MLSRQARKFRGRMWSRSNKSPLSVTPDDLHPLVHLWILRILVALGGHKNWVREHGFNDDGIAEVIGLGHWADPEEYGCPDLENFKFKKPVVVSELKKIYKQRVGKLARTPNTDCLRRNINRLGGLLSLTDTDERILEFTVLLHMNKTLDDAADTLGSMTTIKIYRALAGILDIPEKDVINAFTSKGMLYKSGLLSIDEGHSLSGSLDLLYRDFPSRILSPELESDSETVNLIHECVSPCAPAELTLQDYPHISGQLAVLKPLIRNAVKEKTKGVNVFVYGPPGTGKTQLVRALAHDLGYKLFDVSSEDEGGDPITGAKRLRAYRSAQHFFTKNQTMLLFDEAEDVFSDGVASFGDFLLSNRKSGKRSPAQAHKAWINRMLEENQVPALWLSNCSSGIDPAFIRRFSMIIELPVPPEKKRREIIESECGGLLQPAHIERLAGRAELAPAVVAQAASTLRGIRDELDADGAAEAFDRIVGKTLEVQGHKPLRRHDPDALPETYDPALINADGDVQKIADGLVKARAGRLCLYGPPGTGKTAYGRYLAKRLDAPLLVKRGSDLRSMWVGMTERKIAAAFAEAEQDKAVLLIDEVDGFLQDRRRARQSWEVSHVNEMLTQMESFPGVFIASTNLVDGLDQASLRRFDLKMMFRYLLPEQGWTLFRSHCKSLDLSLDGDGDDLKRDLSRLPNLTPGDFAAVVRRHRFNPVASPRDLLQALTQECSLKEGGRHRIGF